MLGRIFVLSLTVFGVAAAPFRPYYAVLVYVFFAIIRPVSLFPGSLPGWPYSQVVVLAALVGFVLQGLGSWKLYKGKVAFVGLLFYLLWDFLSALNAPFWSVGWGHVDSQLRIFVPCVLAILVATTLFEVKLLAWTIALGEGLVALRFNEYYYILGRGYELQWGSFARKDNNLWTMDLLIGGIFCFFLVLATRPLWLKAIPAILGVFCLSSIMFLYSRGGQLALLVAGAAAFAYLPKRPRLLGVFVITIALIAALAGPSVIEEFSTIFAEGESRDESSTSRLELWAQMADISMARPVFGVGPNHFPIVSQDFGWERQREGHNLWLQWAAELGLPAMLAMAVFYFAPLIHLWPLRWALVTPSTDEDRTIAYLAGAVVCATIAFFVCSQFISIDLLEAPVFVGTMGILLLKVTGATQASTVDSEHAREPGLERREWATTQHAS